MSLIGDISCSLHPLEKRNKIQIHLSPLKSKHIFLAVTILYNMPKSRRKIKTNSFLFFIVHSMAFGALHTPVKLTLEPPRNTKTLTTVALQMKMLNLRKVKQVAQVPRTPGSGGLQGPVFHSIVHSASIYWGPTSIPSELNRVPTLTELAFHCRRQSRATYCNIRVTSAFRK